MAWRNWLGQAKQVGSANISIARSIIEAQRNKPMRRIRSKEFYEHMKLGNATWDISNVPHVFGEPVMIDDFGYVNEPVQGPHIENDLIKNDASPRCLNWKLQPDGRYWCRYNHRPPTNDLHALNCRICIEAEPDIEDMIADMQEKDAEAIMTAHKEHSEPPIAPMSDSDLVQGIKSLVDNMNLLVAEAAKRKIEIEVTTHETWDMTERFGHNMYIVKISRVL